MTSANISAKERATQNWEAGGASSPTQRALWMPAFAGHDNVGPHRHSCPRAGIHPWGAGEGTVPFTWFDKLTMNGRGGHEQGLGLPRVGRWKFRSSRAWRRA